MKKNWSQCRILHGILGPKCEFALDTEGRKYLALIVGNSSLCALKKVLLLCGGYGTGQIVIAHPLIENVLFFGGLT